jgi:Flp pilus assembly protein TadG
VQLLVILVPVLFGLMGFALDLGQLYLVRGELQSAANAMALAAAQQLIGTETSTDAATTFARLTLDNTTGQANKYYFGGLQIGQTNGLLNSEAPDPGYYATVVDAIGADSAGGGEVTGSGAKHVRVTLTADAPLTFWSFLPLATERKAPVAAKAVAGMSAPLCVACAIEPLAVAAVDQGDTTDFGFVPGTEYTLGYVCKGAPTPGALSGTTQRIPYLLLNRLDPNATVFADEQSQLYRVGAGGVPGSATASQACFTINNAEQIWVSAAPVPCRSANPGQSVVSMVCGMTSRFESTYPALCAGIPEVDTISGVYTQDSDVSEITDYTQYQGNARRVITVAIVDLLNAGGAMTVLGFRQFLIEPVQGGVDVSPSDPNGRFAALYIGSVVPVKQGSFSGCQQAAGPGKIVLHQ